MQPTYNAGTKRRPDYQVATTMDDWDPTISAWGSSISENNTWLFPSENKFRIEGTTAVDKNPSVLGEDVVIADMYFLLEDGYDLTNIPSTVLVPQAGNGLETGIALIYDTYYLLTNVGYYGTEGTAQAEKEVDTISVKNNPTKTNYEHPENNAGHYPVFCRKRHRPVSRQQQGNRILQNRSNRTSQSNAATEHR